MLLKAKRFNKLNNITGIILYYKLQFIQLIEGDKKSIDSLYKDIQADKRHFDVETILSTASKQSLWTEWSMAFYDFSSTTDQSDYLRLLLESSFEDVNSKQKNSEVLNILRQHTSLILDK
jgi:hypothetical protein